jgi:hypothetical protein
MAKNELYISIDIEADGRVPGLSSMLSLGAAAFTIDKRMRATFSCNFELLDGASPEHAVDVFWTKHKSAYYATRQDMVSPGIGIKKFTSWLENITGEQKPIAICYPAAYDFKWIDYYCVKFAGKNPFGHSG